jgi:pilus assembly protein CpaB
LKRIRIIAAISAVVTALAVYFYLASMQKPADIVRGPVVVASVKIAAGQEIKPEMVEVKSLPVEAINAAAARSADEVIGRVSSADTEPGEQLLVSRFFKTGEADNTLAYALERGKRAFTVPVDSVTGVAGLIKPRDRVDVLLIIGVAQASLTPQDVPLMTTYSELMLQNIMVLATGQVMQADSTDESTTVETITLSVTPEQAVRLNLAVSDGKIRLILRSPIDTDTPAVPPLQIKQLLN